MRRISNNSEGLPPVSGRPSKIEWRKGRLIGEGASSKVYVGFDSISGCLLAGKEFQLQLLAPERAAIAVANLKSEIEIMKFLLHPNVVRYIGADMVTGSGFCIFMEYVPGGSVRDLLDEFGPLPEQLAKKYVAQLLEGLVYLHEHGVVHRDVKGANVLVSVEGRVKLGDFGSAEMIAAEGSGERMRGTARWMAPEVIRGETGTSAADVWSVGCTMLEMLTGTFPFEQLRTEDGKELPTPAVMLRIAEEGTPVDLPDTLDVSEDCRKFLHACLCKKPGDRATTSQLLASPFLDDSKATQLYSASQQPNASSSLPSSVSSVQGMKKAIGDLNPLTTAHDPIPTSPSPEEDDPSPTAAAQVTLPEPEHDAELTPLKPPPDATILTEGQHQHLLQKALGPLKASALCADDISVSVRSSAHGSTNVQPVMGGTDCPADMDDRVVIAIAESIHSSDAPAEEVIFQEDTAVTIVGSGGEDAGQVMSGPRSNTRGLIAVVIASITVFGLVVAIVVLLL